MRLSCAHGRQKPHISLGYLVTELHSLGEEGRAGERAPGSGPCTPHLSTELCRGRSAPASS